MGGHTPLESMLYDAVRYLLHRMQVEPEFRWHMVATESFDRLCRAEAAFTNRSEEDVRAERMQDLQPPHRRRRADCATNRDRAGDLEVVLREIASDASAAPVIRERARAALGDEES